jgi:peptidoglycan L-alanyl-D-glutamate endopeptidase CwlK
LHLIVTDGVRTTEQQQALYKIGRGVPGKIVTNCDGVLTKSNHQAKADGFGHAVDLAFSVNGEPSWSETQPWQLLGEMAKSQGLIWGGDFKTLQDKPHIELPAEQGIH